MTDLEKVIKGLECCCEYYDACGEDCPYQEDMECANTIRHEALSVLKKYDVGSVKPKKVKGYKPPVYTLFEYECENCESPIMDKQPFCMGCGKAVKWDEPPKEEL